MIQPGLKHVTWRAWPLVMRAIVALSIECGTVEAALQAARLKLPWGLVLSVEFVHLGSDTQITGCTQLWGY